MPKKQPCDHRFSLKQKTPWAAATKRTGPISQRLFRRALRNIFSFSKAFDLARPTIAEREQEEGFTPSEPQMALGRAIEAKLDGLEHQLKAVTGGMR